MFVGVSSVSIVVQPNTDMCEGFTDSNGDCRYRSILLEVRLGGVTLPYQNSPQSCSLI